MNHSRASERRPAPGRALRAFRRALGLGSSGAASLVRGSEAIGVRSFPAPYTGMLAVSNDCDSMTPGLFERIHTFLNTRAHTPWGVGLGLDVADSCWMYAPAPDAFSFFAGCGWDRRGPAADLIIDAIARGWIDSIHSYGNFGRCDDPFTRAHAERAIEALDAAGARLPVWANHGNARNRQNIGRAEHMRGDDPAAPEYHADLLPSLGVRFLWSQRGADVLGGSSPLERMPLRDGSGAWGFRRFHQLIEPSGIDELSERFDAPIWGKHGRRKLVLWYPESLHLQLSEEHLERIASEGLTCVVTQHLGYLKRTGDAFTAEALDALRMLRDYHDGGRILVARTSRLLEYVRARDHLRYEARREDGRWRIDVVSIDDPMLGSARPGLEDVRGITFGVPPDEDVALFLAGKPVPPEEVQHNLPDERGTPSVGFRWHPDARAFAPRPAIEVTARAPTVAPAGEDLRFLFVVGAMKSATTTVWYQLRDHPQIWPCSKKEPNFFGDDGNWARGWDWYRARWEGDAQPGAWLFEATTHYTKYPRIADVPERMASLPYPKKVLYILRDPIARIESHLAHLVSRGQIDLDKIERDPIGTLEYPITLSRYAYQAGRYRDAMPDLPMLLLAMDEIEADQHAALRRICRFVGIDPSFRFAEPQVANVRRSDRGADTIRLDERQVAHIQHQLQGDWEELRARWGFDATRWARA